MSPLDGFTSYAAALLPGGVNDPDAGCAQAVDGRIAAMSEVFALQGMPAAYRLKP